MFEGTSPLVSIVTVVYDDPEGLAKTLESVHSQSYPKIEHIVVDGGSGDETLERIRQFSGQISKWVSEPDKGIYDAMNKGLQMAHGDWVNFLNAGDTYCDSNVLQRIFGSAPIQEKVVFGRSMSTYGSESALRYADFDLGRPDWYLYKMPNHQAVFFHRDFYVTNRYSLNYPFASDTEYMRRAFALGSFRCVDQVVSVFNLGGRTNYYPSFKSFRGLLSDLEKLDQLSWPSRLAYYCNFALQRILPRDVYMKIYLRLIVKR